MIPRSGPSAGPESPGIGRPRFVLGHRNRALAQRPAELGQPHFLEHPQLPSRAAPPATPNARPLISGGSGWGSASCRLLRLLRGSPRLCPARWFALSFETRIRAHRFTPYAGVLTCPPHPPPQDWQPLESRDAVSQSQHEVWYVVGAEPVTEQQSSSSAVPRQEPQTSGVRGNRGPPVWRTGQGCLSPRAPVGDRSVTPALGRISV